MMMLLLQLIYLQLLYRIFHFIPTTIASLDSYSLLLLPLTSTSSAKMEAMTINLSQTIEYYN